MIGPAESIPSISGIASDDRAKVNNATLRNRGWELSVSWNDKLKCGFSYGVGFNVFNYKAVVTKYNNPEGIIYNNHTGLAANKGYYEGMDIGEIWGYRADDLFLSNREIDDYLRNVNLTAFKSNDLWRRGDLKYIDSNGDGRVDGGKGTLADHGDLQIIGNTTPKYSFGINLNLGYKGLKYLHCCKVWLREIFRFPEVTICLVETTTISKNISIISAQRIRMDTCRV